MKTSASTILGAVCAALFSAALVTTGPNPASARPITAHAASSTLPQLSHNNHISRLLPPQLAARLRPGSPQQRQRTMQPNYPTIYPTVFGSDYGANVVKAYKQINGTPLATLVDPSVNSCGAGPFVEPVAMWVQPNKKLWVANFGSSDIRMFPPGSTTSTLTLTDVDNFTGMLYNPTSVSVDSYVSQYVYAGNFSGVSGTPGDIEVWPPGSQSCGSRPKYYLKDPQFGNVWFVANDRFGNLYVNYFDPSNVAHVCFIKRANATAGPSNNICSAGAPAGDFVSTLALGWPGGMQAFRPVKNTLGVVDQTGSAPSVLGINLYHPLPLLSSGPAPTPCTTDNSSTFNPWSFAIADPNGSNLWASDPSVVAGGALVRIHNAAGPCPLVGGPGTQTGIITGFTQLLGTAVSPPQAP